ncbi:MAG TPA: hypothetical protein VFM39_04165 [bacterium]|nr:hypothetical protein [bacterium]
MRVRVAQFMLVLALAAGLATVLSAPASAQQYPPPDWQEVLEIDLRSTSF